MFKMKVRILLAVLIVAGLAACVQATVYNPATDFSATANPNGVWSYGYGTATAGPSGFTAYPEHKTGAAIGVGSIDFWTKTGSWDPEVTHNGTASDVEAYGITWKAGSINLASELAEASYIRWTAPTSGTVQVDAKFTCVQPAAGYDCNVGIIASSGGSVLYSDTDPLSGGGSATFSHTMSLAAGQVIDFANLPGISNAKQCARLEATVKYVPEPSTLCLVGMGVFGLLAYAWRKRK